jgi:hypothetical protein
MVYRYIHWIGVLGKILTGNPWFLSSKDGGSCRYVYTTLEWPCQREISHKPWTLDGNLGCEVPAIKGNNMERVNHYYSTISSDVEPHKN